MKATGPHLMVLFQRQKEVWSAAVRDHAAMSCSGVVTALREIDGLTRVVSGCVGPPAPSPIVPFTYYYYYFFHRSRSLLRHPEPTGYSCDVSDIRWALPIVRHELLPWPGTTTAMVALQGRRSSSPPLSVTHASYRTEYSGPTCLVGDPQSLTKQRPPAALATLPVRRVATYVWKI